jgi:hypothetical protein
MNDNQTSDWTRREIARLRKEADECEQRGQRLQAKDNRELAASLEKDLPKKGASN